MDRERQEKVQQINHSSKTGVYKFLPNLQYSRGALGRTRSCDLLIRILMSKS